MTLQESFIENLESEMSEKNVTYYQISKNTNIAHSTFSKWKNRKANPTIDTLVAVCRYLDVSADRLLGLPEKEPPQFTDEEILLVESYRRADERGREAIRHLAQYEGNERNVKSSTFQQDNVLAENSRAQ